MCFSDEARCFYASATGKAIYLHVITYLIITYMTRTLPTSPSTHTIEYNAVMMIATITGVELLSSSTVLSHLELFMFTRLELLLKFRQNTLLFDITGLESAQRKSEMLPVVSMANAVRVGFAQVLLARPVYQSRSLISIPVRLQNARSPNRSSETVCCFKQPIPRLQVPFNYDSMINLSPLFLHYPREIVSSVAHTAYSHFIQQNDVTYICT